MAPSAQKRGPGRPKKDSQSPVEDKSKALVLVRPKHVVKAKQQPVELPQKRARGRPKRYVQEEEPAVVQTPPSAPKKRTPRRSTSSSTGKEATNKNIKPAKKQAKSTEIVPKAAGTTKPTAQPNQQQQDWADQFKPGPFFQFLQHTHLFAKAVEEMEQRNGNK